MVLPQLFMPGRQPPGKWRGERPSSAPPVSLASSVKDSGRKMLTSLLLAPSLLAYVVPPFAGARAGPVRRVHRRASLPARAPVTRRRRVCRTNPRSNRFGVDRFHTWNSTVPTRSARPDDSHMRAGMDVLQRRPAERQPSLLLGRHRLWRLAYSRRPARP